jgi:Zn-dependent metalloprotease
MRQKMGRQSTPGCGRGVCGFVPPHVLDNIVQAAARGEIDLEASQRSAVISDQLREQRRRTTLALETMAVTAPTPGKADRVIYDCQGTWDVDVPPPARGEGDSVVTRHSVNLAYDHADGARDFFYETLERNGVDNAGMTINVNVNFGVAYNNAIWDGARIVLGTGDGQIFQDFSESPDVLGHEFSHGVVEHTANLEYYSQSGALNESFADVFGSLIEQRMKQQDFATANWLIGDEVMAPQLYGEALRSMAHPGTAYDNPVMGRDPQPAHMRDYYTGKADRQGVHINSGIPNRAFYLTARELGTLDAGRIWYAGLQNLWPTASFADAAGVLSNQARLLVRAGKVADRQAAQAVRAAFRKVGVI